MSDVIEVELDAPVVAHGEEITKLQIRLPKGKEFKKLSGASMEEPFGMMLDFAAILADVPPSTMDELSSLDVGRVCEVVGPLLPGFQGIGQM